MPSKLKTNKKIHESASYIHFLQILQSKLLLQVTVGSHRGWSAWALMRARRLNQPPRKPRIKDDSVVNNVDRSPGAIRPSPALFVTSDFITMSCLNLPKGARCSICNAFHWRSLTTMVDHYALSECPLDL